MMKTWSPLIAGLVLGSASLVVGAYESWDNPTAPFDAQVGRIYDKPIIIEWRLADNIVQACNKASKEFGNSGFGGQQMQACAFWWGDRCVIITKKKPTMHSVGHEIRHCFYGAWHPEPKQ